MRLLRSWAYRLGFRPRLGSIFYSPSRDLMYAFRDADVAGAFRAGLERTKP